MELTEDQIIAYTRRYRQLAGVIGEIEAEMAEISKLINSATEVGFTLDVDGIPISKRNGRREFSLVQAVTLLTPEEREQCKREMFDAKQVRALVEEKGLLDEAMADAGRDPMVRLR